MNQELCQRLHYSYAGQKGSYELPFCLIDSLIINKNFFDDNSGNKLCLVFPTKELAAQWLSVLITLQSIKEDFINHHAEVYEAHKKFKVGDKLILNDDALVEWAGYDSDAFYFKTKPEKNASAPQIKVKIKHIKKIKAAPPGRVALSSFARTKKAFTSNRTYPLDKLLDINTEGNNEFIKSRVCLVTKYKSFDDSTLDVLVNNSSVDDFFRIDKIDENGATDKNSQLLLSKNLSNLALYSRYSPITKIIIDGCAPLQERSTDFSDIDSKRVPTILVTDLSEINSFPFVGNYGFKFFSFTKDNLRLHQQPLSPFYALNQKLEKYTRLAIIKETCENKTLESIVGKIHSIEDDESNNDLRTLKVQLIQMCNAVSRIAHEVAASEVISLIQRLSAIEAFFNRAKIWLGRSQDAIEESIVLLKSLVEAFKASPCEKFIRLKALLTNRNYDYVICPTEEETLAIQEYLIQAKHRPRAISIADINDDLLSSKPTRAILVGWPKSTNMNRLLSCFLFSELTLLFYQFESRYYNSLQRRNLRNHDTIKSNPSPVSVRNSNISTDFDHLYSIENSEPTSSVDIMELELSIDNVQYSKYSAKGGLIESVKAKRVDFENDLFVYSSESHKFLVINELVEKTPKSNIYRRKLDSIKPGDIIALINTDRDILADLVERNTNKNDLMAVRKWTDLWKTLLKDYFVLIGGDFKRLVSELRSNDCKKHEATIRTWLQDENRIGPEDDSDLISIALLTESNLLNDNINTVRDAIRKMTGWRMKASDFISDKIKNKIHEIADNTIVNKKISIEGLGSVIVLKVTEVSQNWENIDIRYANKLLQKDSF